MLVYDYLAQRGVPTPFGTPTIENPVVAYSADPTEETGQTLGIFGYVGFDITDSLTIDFEGRCSATRSARTRTSQRRSRISFRASRCPTSRASAKGCALGDFSRLHRERDAGAGNHNAIFLLGYLDWLAADAPAEKCAAAADMKLAAERGNYSGQMTYASLTMTGALDPCGGAEEQQIAAFIDRAEPQADGYFELLLVDHLRRAQGN